MGTATTPTGLEYPLHHGETFHTPMGTATAVGETLRARHEKHFISLWGQQLVALCMSTNRSRNISYPYGDSNISCIYTEYASRLKHFIPLWGQQPQAFITHPRLRETFHTPLGTATVFDAALRGARCETFHTPMGTATRRHRPCLCVSTETFHTPTGTATHRRTAVSPPVPTKHFIPLWGQQLRRECRIAGHKHAETFHTLMGTATQGTGWRIPQRHGTFHTPTGIATSNTFAIVS